MGTVIKAVLLPRAPDVVGLHSLRSALGRLGLAGMFLLRHTSCDIMWRCVCFVCCAKTSASWKLREQTECCCRARAQLVSLSLHAGPPRASVIFYLQRERLFFLSSDHAVIFSHISGRKRSVLQLHHHGRHQAAAIQAHPDLRAAPEVCPCFCSCASGLLHRCILHWGQVFM